MIAVRSSNGSTREQVTSALFKSLGDPSRLRVLQACTEEPLCVSDIVARTGLSQPSVSSHLACLWDCGLVEREQRGRRVYYGVRDPRVLALLASADDLLTEVEDRVYFCNRYHPEHKR